MSSASRTPRWQRFFRLRDPQILRSETFEGESRVNRTLTVGTLAIVLLIVGVLTTSGFAVVYYRTAERATIRALSAEQSLERTQAQLHDALARLDTTTSQLKSAQGQLGSTQAQLKNAQSTLSHSEQESQRRLEVIFAQQQNADILKHCLAATVVSWTYWSDAVDHYVAWKDNPNDDDLQQAADDMRQAEQIMNPAMPDCQRAKALFAQQP
jgi:hypothetical protein